MRSILLSLVMMACLTGSVNWATAQGLGVGSGARLSPATGKRVYFTEMLIRQPQQRVHYLEQLFCCAPRFLYFLQQPHHYPQQLVCSIQHILHYSHELFKYPPPQPQRKLPPFPLIHSPFLNYPPHNSSLLNFLNSPFVASKNSDVYHRRGCPYADRIYPENEIPLWSAEEAQGRGLRPCKYCIGERGVNINRTRNRR